MTSALPRRTPGSELPRRDDSERIPWDAFAVEGDVFAPYGHPSPALIERARRGWQKFGSLHARTGEGGPQ
ncbi:hypothetical protein ACFWJT_31950 [Streptomyces sp. NPDC127069]|uniref:hypothetical protein n=1 Tax=Streptomyces sp. NPDC127069 TaxID=3347128 RepID=UPI003658873F